MVRRVLAALLSSHRDWEICGEAADGRDATEKIARLNPDLILLDADLPHSDGLEVTRQLVSDDPSRKIIVLTLTIDDKLVRNIFEAGAMGYVLKGNATHDLASAIEAVQRGQTFFTARFAEMILKHYLQEQAESPITEPTMSEHERHCVRLLVDELVITLGHQWRRPRLLRKAVRYLGEALLLSGATGVLWYFLNGEPDHPPQAVSNLLVSVGLKSSPPAPGRGNPNAKVWVDIHTALYYCPGAENYRKTRNGRIARQQDAQMDHFEPASGIPCD